MRMRTFKKSMDVNGAMLMMTMTMVMMTIGLITKMMAQRSAEAEHGHHR
jgi:hypothetical protein